MVSSLSPNGLSTTIDDQPPTAATLAHLRPNNWLGALHLAFGIAFTLLALGLCASDSWFAWAAGQLLLALAGLFWFAALHEAGHRALFRSSLLNSVAGHLAGFIALIPFSCWKPVHNRHHHWTGWQDLDMTTATLVPRKLSRFEAIVLNLCWWLWIPLFAILYRLNNYWNLPRLFRQFPESRQRRRIGLSALVYLSAYVTLIIWIGPWSLLVWIGPGVYLTLALQDLLILSQHTHIPMQLSEGRQVEPFAPREQEIFTRSLVFPNWFARLILLNVDAHELHHRYPQVPGYHLDAIPYLPAHAVRWWRWAWHAKATRAHVLLFQNWDQTGYRV